jgi:hypothetical protein
MLLLVAAAALLAATAPGNAAPQDPLLLCDNAAGLGSFLDNAALHGGKGEAPERYGCRFSDYRGVTPLDSDGVYEGDFTIFEVLKLVKSWQATDGTVHFKNYVGFRNLVVKNTPATRIPMTGA